MSGNGKGIGNSEQILQTFVSLLTKQSKDHEKRAEHTNATLSKLTDSIDTLTRHHIESKKDQEFNAKRMDRYEETQKENAEVQKTMSKTIVLLEERQKNQRGWMQRAVDVTIGVVSAVLITKIT